MPTATSHRQYRNGVEVELRVGLRLINVNVQDITDESGYIDALGREAAARAINEAKVKVSTERFGDIGAAEADRESGCPSPPPRPRRARRKRSRRANRQLECLRREREAEAMRMRPPRKKPPLPVLEESYARKNPPRQRGKRDEATVGHHHRAGGDREKEIEVLAEADKPALNRRGRAPENRARGGRKRRIELTPKVTARASD
jgi:flotillin